MSGRQVFSLPANSVSTWRATFFATSAPPSFFASNGDTCLYSVPTCARSASSSTGALSAAGIWSSAYSDGVRASITASLSAPVLDDAERAQVGTLYKQVSPFEAKKLGGALVAKNVARHVETLFGGKEKSWRPLVYCWRGGKRSGAMAHILREIGWQAETLPGGYRAYRRWVVGELATRPAQFEFVVVHGPTGSG